jgi:hypothetical protein
MVFGARRTVAALLRVKDERASLAGDTFSEQRIRLISGAFSDLFERIRPDGLFDLNLVIVVGDLALNDILGLLVESIENGPIDAGHGIKVQQ